MRPSTLAFAMTILAGTHMAATVLPASSASDVPPIVPIQWGGYGQSRPYYDPYRYGPGGYYEPRYSDRYYGGRMVDPDSFQTMRRWRWESDQGSRYSNPPWAGRGW